MKNMSGSAGNGGTYTPGGGSGITGGSSSGGGTGSTTLLRTRTILTQTYWNRNWPYTGDLWVAFFTVLIDAYGEKWTYMDGYYKTPIIEGTNTGASAKNEFDYYCTWPLRWDTAGDGNSDLISMSYLIEYYGNIGWSDFFLENNTINRDGFHIYFDSVHETNKNPKVRLWINYQYYWHGNIDPFTNKPFTIF